MLGRAAVRFWLLYGFLVSGLLLTVLAAFALHGILSWSVGLIYILYDSFLQCWVVWRSSRALNSVPVVEKTNGGHLPTVSVVVPARNEKDVLNECLQALLSQTHAPDEIIVVDDGSIDDTAQEIRERFGSNLRVICKEHSGKADSLNNGWRMARSEIIVTVDADTILEPGAILEVCRTFSIYSNLEAAGGVLIPRCAAAPLGRGFQFYQTFEYVYSFLERLAWMNFGTLVLVSGAFSAFRRSVLERLGGFDKNSSVEDYELIYRLYRDGYTRGIKPLVQVMAHARAVTDAPCNIEKFLLQRGRWFAGFIETLFRNRDMVADSRYGRFGKFMLPLKLMDTLKPFYGLLALLVFWFYVFSGFRSYLVIIYILIAKLLLDVILRCWAFSLYHRWQSLPISPALWAKSLAALLSEPFAFQILRHVAAVFGVLAYLHGRIVWTQQR